MSGQEEEMSEVEEVDAVEYLASLLQTEDGESITTVIATLAKHLESQNKILIKILSTLSAQKTS
jgi:hypothetical protein